ncbi:hypothetical protein NHF46_08395 [Arthrobacter alpinus]|nr:hypothetical protein [Arthrobacter alpinus]
MPTEETLAAAWLLQHHVPGLKVRVVNVMDALVLPPRTCTRTALPIQTLKNCSRQTVK